MQTGFDDVLDMEDDLTRYQHFVSESRLGLNKAISLINTAVYRNSVVELDQVSEILTSLIKKTSEL